MPVIDEKQELAKKSDLLTKQDILTPGTGITIQNNVISTTGTGGSTVTVTPVLSTGTRIAAMEVDGTIYTLFAPTPPSVGVTQVVDQGVELARVTIDGVATSIYAPESSTVLSGTSAPSSSLGEDNNLYVQYTVTSGVYTVDMTYVKLSGAWVELAASGSEVEPNPHGATTASLSSIGIDGTNYAINGLPENYNPSIQALKITSSTDVNEYGWGVADDTYYYESAITWSCAGTTYTKTNASPALGAMYQNYYEYFMLVSTNQAATAFNHGYTTRSMTYLNTTWYYTFGSNGTVTSHSDLDGLNYIGYVGSDPELTAKWLIDHSEVYFDTMHGTFSSMGTPYSGHLFSGGGSQSDLSDATFDVETDGTVHATDFQIGNTSILNQFTGATSSVAGAKGMVPAPLAGDDTKFLKGDGTWGVVEADSGLPENYTPTPLSLQIESPSDCNELGWGIIDDIYYFDTAASWTVGDRTFTKDNATPALGAVFHPSNSQWYHSFLLSTNADATGFYCTGYGPNRQKYSFEYNGHTWYYSGGEYSLANASVSGIEVVSEYSDSEFSSFLKYLIDQSEVYFDDYANTITHVGTPASGVLFAGGGEEADLSDATFKVTAEGDIIGNAFHGATTLANGSVGLVPAPLIADKDKFLKGDGTWAEAGGNVDDVQVNGTSVLDSNKIAQITSYREVTQAEYDALPASKESDNVLYCIKDKATADTTVAPIIYSEDEREVGVWTDGKPLYQKTWIIPKASLSSGETTYTHNNNLSIDTLVNVQGTVTNSRPLVEYHTNGSWACSIYNIGNNSFWIYLGSSVYSGMSDASTVKVTLQYTKTTDTPGSGKYAPSGVPAVHYSENEQVVGTWIDGSTIYEKTYIFETEITTIGTTTWYDTGISNSGIDKMIGGAVCTNGTGTSYHLNISRDTGNTLKILACRDSNPCQAKYLTYRYTKQTS